MDRSIIEQRVVGVISEVLKVPAEKLTSETRFKEDLKTDSLDLAMLLMTLEEEFNDTIPDGQEAGLTTVGGVIDFVVAQASKRKEA